MPSGPKAILGRMARYHLRATDNPTGVPKILVTCLQSPPAASRCESLNLTSIEKDLVFSVFSPNPSKRALSHRCQLLH